MELVSVEEVSGFKYYRVVDEKGEPFIAEPLFISKKPKSRLTADIIRSIEGIIKERKNYIKHSSYIKYEGVEQINGEFCLLRKGEEIYRLLYSEKKEHFFSLERIIDWIHSLGEVALQAESSGITWSAIYPGSLYLNKDNGLMFMDPDISSQLIRYRELKSVNLIEIYQAPEVFRDNTRDQQSLIYSAGIIMYYLFTGELPYKLANESDYSKSDLVHEILKVNPLEPVYLNSALAPSLNSFIMETIHKERERRVKNWGVFLKRLEAIKEDELYASKEEREKTEARAKRVIKTTGRKKGFINFWRKRWKTLAVITSIVLLIYIVNLFTAVDPYITEETTPEQVVEYFYKAINEKNTSLLDEASGIDLKNLDRMVASVHVIESMRSAYDFSGEEQEGVFGLIDLEIEKLDDQPTFKAEYFFYLYIEEEIDYSGEVGIEETNIADEDRLRRYEVMMTDIIRLEQVEDIWRVMHIEGSLRLIIEGRVMELFE